MSKKNTRHAYTSTKPDLHTTWFRLGNYGLLLVLIFVHKFWGITFGDPIYFLVIGAIVGVDVGKLITALKFK